MSRGDGVWKYGENVLITINTSLPISYLLALRWHGLLQTIQGPFDLHLDSEIWRRWYSNMYGVISPVVQGPRIIVI